MPDTTDTNPTETSRPVEYMPRDQYPTGTIPTQDGFELPALKKMVDDFAARNNNEEEEKPIGWFITFFGKELNVEGEEVAWKADFISQIRVYELILNNTDNTIRLEHLDGKNELEESEKLKYKPATVRLHLYDHATNYSTENTIVSRVPELVIQDVNTQLGYGVGVINGFRPDLRAAYMDHNTIMQIHRAYNSIPDNITLRFIFTGAEINYGEMVSPVLQQERIRDWAPAANDLDPSVSTTLKIEPVYSIGNSGRYESGGLNTWLSSSEAYISLPGLFVLLACKRYWEAVAAIHSALAPAGEVFVKSSKKSERKLNEQKKSDFSKIIKGVTPNSLRGLVEEGRTIQIY